MMRRSTGLALIAIGAILTFAVHAQLAILNLKLTGLVLIFTGLAGLQAPQRACRWLRSHQSQLRDALDRFMAPPDLPPRVPLDTLLHARATAGLHPRATAGRHG
jgi:hypothetical protein